MPTHSQRFLKTKDYYTFMVGKWHLGYAPDQNPKARGFDQSLPCSTALIYTLKTNLKTIRATPNTRKMVKRSHCLTTTIQPTFYTKAFEYLDKNKAQKPFLPTSPIPLHTGQYKPLLIIETYTKVNTIKATMQFVNNALNVKRN